MKNIDELLRGGTPPLPGRVGDDSAWDDNAEKIVAAALSAGAASAELDAILAAPSLSPEAGESGAGQAAVKVGVSSMSDSDRPKPSVKRPSLKELAERVSKTPPPPSLASTPAPMSSRAGSSPAVSTPLPSQRAGNSLADLARSSAAPPSIPAPSIKQSSPPPASVPPASVPVAAAPSAPPSQPPVSAAAATASNVVALEPKKAAGKPAEAKESEGNSKIGLFVALGGIAAAAALFFVLRNNISTTNTNTDKKPVAAATTEVKEEPTAKAEEPPKAEANNGAPEPEKKDDAVDISNLQDTTAAPTDGPAPIGTIAQNGATGPSGPPKPVKVEADGTLDDAMKKVVGDQEKKEEQPQPASEENRPKNVPDQPPQGSVTAAVGSVMGGAKACVAGADDVSRATITFGSSGAVQSVSVSGWAAGKPAASCIQSALKGANVGPFSKPTYSFGVTIRP